MYSKIILISLANLFSCEVLISFLINFSKGSIL